MCTAICLDGASALFGRTLDHEHGFGEEAVTVGRCGRLFREGDAPSELSASHTAQAVSRGEHFAIMGTAVISEGVPLFFDAVNECGLAAAALNFPMSAVYLPSVAGKRNIPSYELISRVLAECRTLGEAAELLRGVNVTPESFSESMPATPLHWMLSDGREAIVAEPLSGGLSVMPCPSGVLTNDPPYEYQLLRLTEYMSLVPTAPENRLIPDFEPKIYSGGLGAMGLPGDMSSTSRHIRAAYAAAYTLSGGSEWEEVSRFFHIASAVGVPDGTSVSPEGKPAKTRYTALYDITHKTYYLRTYDSHRVFSLPYAEIPCDGGIKRYPFPRGGAATPLCAL